MAEAREAVEALTQVEIAPLMPERFRDLLTPELRERFDTTVATGREVLAGRVVWNVNSTARGGGVAEMLQSLVAYARGAGVDARWVVIEGDDDFFLVTKRIHNQLHGAAGDGGPLGDAERAIYEATSARNAIGLSGVVQRGDIVVLHDPQTAGLVAPLVAQGAHVVWRAHIGLDLPNERARGAWDFLRPYVEPAAAYVFSREAFVWEGLDPARLAIIPPSIDPFSAKNQALDPDAVGAVLYAAGLSSQPAGPATFLRRDGSPARVDRRAELIGGPPLAPDVPLLAQVSRWDRLKDPLGVIEAFVTYLAPQLPAHLVLAGPETAAVTDDPEGAQVLDACVASVEAQPAEIRERIHLALLPMADAEENAVIVNAVQRRADVVAQKSLAEGFGLTVSEAMWKGRPVVASRVGGIQDQIEDGTTGILVDPRDLEAFGKAALGLLSDRAAAEQMGVRARERVRDEFIPPRHFAQYVELFARLVAVRGEPG
jgi:trehalose synthase